MCSSGLRPNTSFEEAGAFLKRPFLEQRVVRRIRLDFQLVVGDLDLIEPQLLPL